MGNLWFCEPAKQTKLHQWMILKLWVIICFNCRNDRPRLTFRILCYLFCSAIVGLVIFSFLTIALVFSSWTSKLSVFGWLSGDTYWIQLFFIGHRSLNTLSLWGYNILLLPSLVLSSTWCQWSHSWWHYLLGMNQNSNIYYSYILWEQATKLDAAG